MDLSPSVVFVSCVEDEPPDNLVKLIIGELPDIIISEDVISYPWHLDTKYYEADILLSVMKNKVLSSPAFASTVHGIVIYFNSEDDFCLNKIEDWLLYLKEYEADIKIVACQQCFDNPDNGVKKQVIQKWCLEKGFELVELNPISEEDSDSDSDFAETNGINRISQALKANIWPNLTMKDRKLPTTMAGLLSGGHCKSSDSDHEAASSRLTADNIEPSLEEISELETFDFCDLFSQLASMKEKAASLPQEERRDFAEKLVLSYWKAIGGDEDEIRD